MATARGSAVQTRVQGPDGSWSQCEDLCTISGARSTGVGRGKKTLDHTTSRKGKRRVGSGGKGKSRRVTIYASHGAGWGGCILASLALPRKQRELVLVLGYMAQKGVSASHRAKQARSHSLYQNYLVSQLFFSTNTQLQKRLSFTVHLASGSVTSMHCNGLIKTCITCDEKTTSMNCLAAGQEHP